MELELTGFDDLIEEITKLDISESKERKILKKCGETIKNKMEQGVPKRTGREERSIKTYIKNTDEGLVSITKTNVMYDLFNEWGTSKSKNNVGKVAKAIDEVKEELYKIVSEEAFR